MFDTLPVHGCVVLLDYKMQPIGSISSPTATANAPGAAACDQHHASIFRGVKFFSHAAANQSQQLMTVDLSTIHSSVFAVLLVLKAPPSSFLKDCGVCRPILTSSSCTPLSLGFSPLLSSSSLPFSAIYRSNSSSPSYILQPLLPPKNASDHLVDSSSFLSFLPFAISSLYENGVSPLHHVHIEHCEHCENHSTTTWHVPGSYEERARVIAASIRTRLPPTYITSNSSSRTKPRCGAFEVTFEGYESIGKGGAKLLFSKIAGSPLRSEEAVVASIGSVILPRRHTFPGGEDFLRQVSEP